MASDGERARREYINAKVVRLRGGPEVTNAMQKALSRYLLWYAEASTGDKVPTFDPEIAFDLGDALRDVVQGRAHPLLMPPPKTGTPPASYATKDAQRDAVRYILWSLAGLIPDRAPYATVCSRYKAKRETVRSWMKAMRSSVTVPATANSDALHLVITAMERAGHYYPTFPGARTDEAIRRRDAKRREG